MLTTTERSETSRSKLKDFIVTQKDSWKYFGATEFCIYYKKDLNLTSKERPTLGIRNYHKKISDDIDGIIKELRTSVMLENARYAFKVIYIRC